MGLMGSTLWMRGQSLEFYPSQIDTTFESALLGYSLPITLRLPQTWTPDADDTFPVLVVFDRQNERSHGFILRSADYLMANDHMPESILVSIEANWQQRLSQTDLAVSERNGQMETYARMLFEELLPWIEEVYRANQIRVFAGHSRFGYFTTWLFQNYTDSLTGVVSLSPFFGQTNVSLVDSMQSVFASSPQHHTVYTYCIGNDYPDQFLDMDSALKDLSNPMLRCEGAWYPHASHNATPGLHATAGLYTVFETFSHAANDYFNLKAPGIDEIHEVHDRLKAHYGAPISLSVGVLNGAGWNRYNEQDFTGAAAIWEEMLRLHPGFIDGYWNLGEVAKATGQDPEPYYDLFRAALPNCTMYSEEEKKQVLLDLESE